jgi:uncharacterized protein (DUF1330 family)
MAINPDGTTLRWFLQGDDGKPFVMLNLLRFVPGGREKYGEYAAKTQPFLREVGGEVVYFGASLGALVGAENQAWDAVLLVRYPSRAAFMAMVMNPGYQAITHLRTEALAEAVLEPTTAW